MLYKADIREVTIKDLEALKDNQIPESHTLDYKREFPTDRDGRLSLAADVVAFANTRGGDLIIGVDESEGCIRTFVPISLNDRDAALLGLQSALTDLVEPKIPGIHLAAISMGSGFIVVVRTPASFQAPDRVRKSSIFYARTSTGIDPMDITTLRSAFLQNSTAIEKAKAFRAKRIEEMHLRPLPVPLPKRALGVLHVLPMASIFGTTSFEIEALHSIAQSVRPPLAHGYGQRVNLDGVMSYCGVDELVSYTQVFRDGALESIMPVQSDRDDIAWVGEFENALRQGHHVHLTTALQNLGLDGPTFLMLSFVNIGGKPLEPPNSTIAAITGGTATVPGYYKDLLLPEMLIESFVSSSPEIYGPLFDLVWNAAGRKSRPKRP